MGDAQSSLGSSQVTVMVVVRSLSTLGVRGLLGTHCASAAGRTSTNKTSTMALATMAESSRQYDAVDREKRIALASPKQHGPTFQATTEKISRRVEAHAMPSPQAAETPPDEARRQWPNRTGRWYGWAS